MCCELRIWDTQDITAALAPLYRWSGSQEPGKGMITTGNPAIASVSRSQIPTCDLADAVRTATVYGY